MRPSRSRRLSFRSWRLAPAVLLVAAAAARASVTVTSELDRNQATVDDQLELTVTVSGDQASLPSPRIPPMEAFSVYDAGKSTSLNFVNGAMSSSVSYTFVLKPRSAGKFKIPAIGADGASPSAPIDVQIFPAGANAGAANPGGSPNAGAAPPPAGRAAPAERRRGADVFVTASLDKTRAYVNEQVTLTIRFLNAVQLLGPANYDAPELTGFLTEDLPPARTGMTSINGRPYQVTEIKVALFPLQPGRLKIGSAAVHCQVAALGRSTGQDFFDRFFAMTAPQPVTVRTDPLTLTVDPLPPGKPEDFSGVVGRLSARLSADRTSVKAGDAVTLTATVTGTGNIKSLPEPKKPDLPSLRFFETESASTVDKSNDRVGGTKTFRTVVVPRASGDVRVPPFAFWYFDPQRKSYARAETSALELKVAPGAPGAVTPLAPAPSAAPTAPGLAKIADDIRYLHGAPASAPLSAALAAFAGLGPWHALPFVLLGGAALADWRRRAADADPRGRRRREALGRAQARLQKAAALPPTDAAALIGEALAGYVADKLGAAAAGLTLKSAADGLKASPKPPSDAVLRRLGEVWEEADLRRFAPGAAGGDVPRFAADVAALLKSLEEELRP